MRWGYRLGLSPAELRHVSLCELEIWVKAWTFDNAPQNATPKPMSRKRFEELAARYPD